MVKITEASTTNTSNLRKIIKGSAIALVFSLICLFIFSIILTYSRVSEKTMPTVVISITIISILLGSQISTHHIKKNGILNGGAVGVIYIMILYIVSSIITKDFTLNSYAIGMILGSITAGVIGGIIGVNR